MTRSLVVARWSPWPAVSGARLRSSNVIAALADLGEVDVFLLGHPDDVALEPPPSVTIRRLGRADRVDGPVRSRDRLVGILPGTRPAAVRAADFADARRRFESWLEDSYDVVWFVRIESWLAVHDLVDAPAIVDFDDLRDQLALSRLERSWPDPDPARGLRTAVRRLADVADARAWRRLQRSVAAQVAAVAVCSELDRRRLGVSNGVVVPNGIDMPAGPSAADTTHAHPTICLHGSLTYGPNADAAMVLVRDVAPRVRRRVADVVVRLVGRASPAVRALAGDGEVVVTGAVDDMAAELSGADLVAVPLRQGAGTRIKVLEAMAHRVPVVATSIAVEGLDVVPGEHLLVADGPEAFADACVTALTDDSCRRRLIDAGERLVVERYGWEHAHRAVNEAVRRVAATARG